MLQHIQSGAFPYRRSDSTSAESALRRLGWRMSGKCKASAGGRRCPIRSRSGPVMVEPYMITLTAESDVFPTFQHEGLEFLYMLEGEVVYRHGDKTYTMLPGDALFFDADAPHGPEELKKLPIRFLSVICYPKEE